MPVKSKVYPKKVYKKKVAATKTKTSYKKYNKKYVAKDKPVLSGLNDTIKNAGNSIAKTMLGSIPGISQIFGYGDYHVPESNTLIHGDTVPQFMEVTSRMTRVRHREYIQDVISSATANTFNINSFTINPGMVATFPWLASVAANYEQYKIKGMIFEFKTMSSDALNSTNTSLGSVIMATQYNVLDSAFSNKQQMENYEFAASTKPSCSLIHAIECAPHESPLTELYTRNISQSIANSDLRFYDFGKFSIATTALQGTSVNLGELWVSYDVELYKPKLGAIGIASDHYQLGSGVVSSSPFFNAQKSSSSTFGTTITNTTITLPPNFAGQFMITYNVQCGTGAAITNPSFAYNGNCTALALFANNSAQLSGAIPNGTTVSNLCWVIAGQSSGGGSITVSGGTYPTSSQYGDIVVLPIVNTN